VIGRFGGNHIGTVLDTSAVVARWNPRSSCQLKYIRLGYSKLIIGKRSSGSLSSKSSTDVHIVASRLVDPILSESRDKDVYDRDTFNSPELYHGIKLEAPRYDGEYHFRVC
jgi:hypothetical protein